MAYPESRVPIASWADQFSDGSQREIRGNSEPLLEQLARIGYFVSPGLYEAALREAEEPKR